MRAVVTGGAGFIGSAICEQLLLDGHQVTVLDDLNDYYAPAIKARRSQALASIGGSNYAFEKCDIADQERLSAAWPSQVDIVYNLAARAGVRPSIDAPELYARTNIHGTINLLELCRKHDVDRFFLASTSSLYGHHNQVPFDETASTAIPPSPYAATKMGAESMSATYSELYDITSRVARYFTVYGPNGRPDMAPRIFMEHIARGDCITVFGDGTQTRDFTYITDIAKGSLLVAQFGKSGHEVFNLGNDAPVTVNELISTIEEFVGRNAIIKHAARHPADMLHTRANIDKARKMLDWNPSTSLRQGIAKSIQGVVKA